jgi:hypothetical protein
LKSSHRALARRRGAAPSQSHVDAALRYSSASSNRPSVDIDALIDSSDLFLLPLSGSAATAALDAAQLSVTGRVLDLAFEARVAFYAYQAWEQILELRRSIADALRASFEVARKLHEAGNVTDSSFANERALYEEARVACADAEARAANSSMHRSAFGGRRERSGKLSSIGQDYAFTPSLVYSL